MSILDRIIAAKRNEIADRRSKRSEQQLERALSDAPPVRDFFVRLSAEGSIKLIAEVKKASPSKGIIRHDFNPVEIAKTYEASSATCISVLTDEPFFHGKLEDLTAIRQDCSLPLLRKDFILDEYQLLEARVAGADAVLLIAECLDDCHLRSLHNQSLELGMTPLVEFYELENLPRVLEAGATLIGVNNRDLRTFRTDLQHTIRIRKQIPASVLLVAESGIHTRQDVESLESAGVDAMLVGEHLMASPDIGAAVRVLLGQNTE